jgi:heme-degrading monooxygenase HmoA
MYFHKVSGKIPENKHREFEQTLGLVREKLTSACSGFEFSKDQEDDDHYFFISYWDKLDSMQDFTLSNASVMLLGAFKTLGTLNENKRGLMIEIN